MIVVYTRIGVDFEVLCNYSIACHKREKNRAKGKHKCHKNFSDKNGAMEAEAGIKL